MTAFVSFLPFFSAFTALTRKGADLRLSLTRCDWRYRIREKKILKKGRTESIIVKRTTILKKLLFEDEKMLKMTIK